MKTVTETMAQRKEREQYLNEALKNLDGARNELLQRDPWLASVQRSIVSAIDMVLKAGGV